MSFFGHSEVARCRFFSTCLKGTALHWFNGLPPWSVDSWSILKSKFYTRFSSNKRKCKLTTSLITIYQRRNESLRDYLTRFRAKIVEITGLVETLAINYLVAGIDRTRHGHLIEEIFEKEPKILQAAIQIIEHRVKLQEAVRSIQTSRSPRTRTVLSHRPRWSDMHSNRSPRMTERWDTGIARPTSNSWRARSDRGRRTNSSNREYPRPTDQRDYKFHSPTKREEG